MGQSLKGQLYQPTRNSNIWLGILASKELLTGYVMEIRGMWKFYHFPCYCGHTPETVDHIFQCKLQDTL